MDLKTLTETSGFTLQPAKVEMMFLAAMDDLSAQMALIMLSAKGAPNDLVKSISRIKPFSGIEAITIGTLIDLDLIDFDALFALYTEKNLQGQLLKSLSDKGRLGIMAQFRKAFSIMSMCNPSTDYGHIHLFSDDRDEK